jgi:hypothetical protein
MVSSQSEARATLGTCSRAGAQTATLRYWVEPCTRTAMEAWPVASGALHLAHPDERVVATAAILNWRSGGVARPIERPSNCATFELKMTFYC